MFFLASLQKHGSKKMENKGFQSGFAINMLVTGPWGPGLGEWECVKVCMYVVTYKTALEHLLKLGTTL